MRWLPLVVLLGAGCPSSAIPTKMGLARIESKHTINTTHPCERPEVLLAVTDGIIVCLVTELHEADKIESIERALAAIKKDPPWFGLVPQPEGCYVRKPCSEDYRCQRTAGCTYWGISGWVSEVYPPICSDEWPMERAGAHPKSVGCVESGEQQVVSWPNALTHELAHVVHEKFKIGSNPRTSPHEEWASSIQTRCEPKIERGR